MSGSHVLCVTSPQDHSISHPDHCVMNGFTLRDSEHMEHVDCEFINLDDEILAQRISPWPLPVGRYNIEIGADVEFHDGEVSGSWWIDTTPLDEFKPPGTRVNYGGQLLRSLNEMRMAVLFDLLKIRWTYEPVTHHLSNGRLYVPDFIISDVRLPAVVEIKDAVVVRELAEALGMPAWSTANHDPLHYEIGPVAVDPTLLADDIHKPFLLANDTNQVVWVVGGKLSAHQAFVAFHPGGVAFLSRRCPLFADTAATDEAANLVAQRDHWLPATG